VTERRAQIQDALLSPGHLLYGLQGQPFRRPRDLQLRQANAKIHDMRLDNVG